VVGLGTVVDCGGLGCGGTRGFDGSRGCDGSKAVLRPEAVGDQLQRVPSVCSGPCAVLGPEDVAISEVAMDPESGV
jgi:hypothetical protein